MTQPTGVFVRLPLSDEQHDTLYHTIRRSGDEVAILAVGTPVTGGDLNPVAFMSPRDCASPSISFRPFHDYTPLVRQSDAQAAIAALEAEVGRKDARIAELEEELSGFHAGLSELIAKEVADLKGPEA
ncbi:MAG: hypothetical protein [Caudoviricetes sp.]|nr:MAG: hypothetical protein [Caudoviricetes sp.]